MAVLGTNSNGQPQEFEKEERHESELIRRIVEKIFLKLHDKIPRATKGLVVIDNQVEELNCLLCVGSDDVRVIRIWGMGGIGKTTLAKVVCNIFSSDFEACSFIKNVKDVSKESDFVQLQQQLLYEILEDENLRIWNVESGVNVIKNRLRSKKILLILDDVNHLDQLKYLVEERDWFGSGSRIIITTRDRHLLNVYRVDGIHKCKELNIEDSLKLFCLKAFKKEQPEEGYKEISREIVNYANGLPLALDVLGSLLFGRDVNHWEEILKRLKRYPEVDIVKKLEISYNGLNNEAEQRMFIYIACFSKGMNRGLVIDILDSLDLYPTSGIDVLIDRSLITISENNILWVHDLLQDMGWEILRKQSPTEPGNRTGLKLHKDILDVLTKNEGTKAIEIINQESSMDEVANCTCNNPEAFSKMTKLKFLRISNVDFLQGIEYLSNELRILEWYKYPLKSVPSSFQSNGIFELNMRCSQIEKLWEGAMCFPNLRTIDLSCSENLIKTPNLTGTPRLEALDLHGCRALVEGHLSILVHKRLKYLNMAGCISLESLPSKIEMECLKTLILSDCSKIKRIPEFGENMKCLEKLHVDGTDIEEIPPSIKRLTGLKHLNFSRCLKLGKRHSSIAPMISLLPHLCWLEDLNLSWCNLFEIPNAIGCLSSLDYLDLKGNNFITLPSSISQLTKLIILDLSHCKRLQSLSELPLSQYFIPNIFVNDCTSLETLPQFLQISESGEQSKCFYELQCFYELRCFRYPKLIENDNNVAIVKRHLQGPNGQKVPLFKTTFGRKIPQWFTHQRVGNYVSVELPPNWCDNTWLGFALCASFWRIFFKDSCYEIKISVFATILLPDLQCICPPKELVVDWRVDTQAVWYVPKDTKAFELFEYIDCNQCSGHIIFYFETMLFNWIYFRKDIFKQIYYPIIQPKKIKINYPMECGVRLVYKEDVEELIQTTSQASDFKMKCGVRLVDEQDVEELIQINPDRLAWIHYKRNFSVKSASRVNNKHKFTLEEASLWKLICKAKLHERQKFFLWKVCTGSCLPIRKRFDSKFKVAITCCPLCNDDMEDQLHMYYWCAFSRLAWFGNSWGFRLGSIPFQSVIEWVSFFLSPPFGFLPEAIDEEAFALFATVAMNSVWKMHNKFYMEGKVTPLEEVPSIVADAYFSIFYSIIS